MEYKIARFIPYPVPMHVLLSSNRGIRPESHVWRNPYDVKGRNIIDSNSK